jgi:porin
MDPRLSCAPNCARLPLVTMVFCLAISGIVPCARAAEGEPGDAPASAPATVSARETCPEVSGAGALGVTGDWGGLRAQSIEEGLTLAGYVVLDVSRNFQGGLDTEATPVRYVLDLSACLDTERALHWPGGTALLEFQSHDGPNATEQLAGDLLGFDNTDARAFVQIYQLWYEQSFAPEAVRVKIGKIDASCDFSVMDHGKEFINSTMAYSVAMFPLPTYPDPAPGVLAFWQPNDHLALGAGAFYANRHDTFLDLAGHPSSGRGSSGGMFYIAEITAHWSVGTLPGHAGVGGWAHTGTFQTLDGDSKKGAGGCYFFGDQTLWSDDDASGLREIGLFVDGGVTNPRLNAVTRQIGGGLAVTGLLPGRPDDLAGVGAAWVHIGHSAGTTHEDELSVEVFYKCVLTPWASLKADLQYLRHPGAELDDAVVATCRAELSF